MRVMHFLSTTGRCLVPGAGYPGPCVRMTLWRKMIRKAWMAVL